MARGVPRARDPDTFTRRTFIPDSKCRHLAELEQNAASGLAACGDLARVPRADSPLAVARIPRLRRRLAALPGIGATLHLLARAQCYSFPRHGTEAGAVVAITIYLVVVTALLGGWVWAMRRAGTIELNGVAPLLVMTLVLALPLDHTAGPCLGRPLSLQPVWPHDHRVWRQSYLLPAVELSIRSSSAVGLLERSAIVLRTHLAHAVRRTEPRRRRLGHADGDRLPRRRRHSAPADSDGALVDAPFAAPEDGRDSGRSSTRGIRWCCWRSWGMRTTTSWSHCSPCCW